MPSVSIAKSVILILAVKPKWKLKTSVFCFDDICIWMFSIYSLLLLLFRKKNVLRQATDLPGTPEELLITSTDRVMVWWNVYKKLYISLCLMWRNWKLLLFSCLPRKWDQEVNGILGYMLVVKNLWASLLKFSGYLGIKNGVAREGAKAVEAKGLEFGNRKDS